MGKTRFKVVNPKSNKKYSIEFHLIRDDFESISGLRASEHLQSLKANSQDIHSVESSGVGEKGPKVKTSFCRTPMCSLGKTNLEGDHHLEIDKNVPPVQLPTRKVPIALRKLLTQELGRLSNIEVIPKVDKHTRFSAYVVRTKGK